MKKPISTILILSALAAPLSGLACFADTPKINTGSNDTCKTLFEKTYIEKRLLDYQLKFADRHNFDLCKVFESFSKFSPWSYVMSANQVAPEHFESLLEYAKNHKVKLHDIIKDCADKARGNNYHEEYFIYELDSLASFLNRNPQYGELREFYERYSNQQKEPLDFLSEITVKNIDN